MRKFPNVFSALALGQYLEHLETFNPETNRYIFPNYNALIHKYTIIVSFFNFSECKYNGHIIFCNHLPKVCYCLG